MLILPFQVSPTEYSIFVALRDESIERIRQYDPAEVVLNKLPRFQNLKLKDVLIGYANEEDQAEVTRILKADNDPVKALRWLSRGFKYKPEAGDHDGPYQKITGSDEMRGKKLP